MIGHLYDEKSPVAAILDMIARRGPLLMRAGGGALSQETGRNRQMMPRLTKETRARAVDLGRSGRYTVTEIARMVGSSQAVIFKALQREGVKAPDGRVRHRRVTS